MKNSGRSVVTQNSETTDNCTDNPSWSTRLVLLAGIISGLSGILTAPLFSPDQFMVASDVYLHAADALLAGENIYDVTPPDRPGYYYIYPPIVIVAFVPHALLGTALASFAIQTLLNVGFAVGIAAVLWRALSRREIALTRVDGTLLVGFALLSAYSAITVVNGQVTLGLAFAFALGFDALERNREALAGVAFASAALVKVFPAAIGLWLLRRRATRGIVAAVLTGVGGLVLGLLFLDPEFTVTYFTEVLTGRYEGFDGAPEPTETRDGLQRQLATLFGLSPPYLTPLSFVLLAPVVLFLYRDVDTDRRRQAAILGTILAVLLFFPLQRLYMSLLIYPLVVLLFVLPAGRPRTVILVGSLVSFLRIDYAFVEMIVEVVSLPASFEAGVLAPLEWGFQFVLPPTLGMWLLLAGCLLVHYE